MMKYVTAFYNYFCALYRYYVCPRVKKPVTIESWDGRQTIIEGSSFVELDKLLCDYYNQRKKCVAKKC